MRGIGAGGALPPVVCVVPSENVLVVVVTPFRVTVLVLVHLGPDVLLLGPGIGCWGVGCGGDGCWGVGPAGDAGAALKIARMQEPPLWRPFECECSATTLPLESKTGEPDDPDSVSAL